jgi:hypothetical protein
MRARRLLALAGIAIATARSAQAEPMFLARQYTRCTACHYSPTGGGLLTRYGRSLTDDLSSTRAGGATQGHGRENAFAWGHPPTPDWLGLGIDVRPAHLTVDSGGFTTTEDFLMSADVLAALSTRGWTLYGELGREPLPKPDGPKIASYEHWIARDLGRGLSVRAGRFLPAYGIHLADHTAFTRLNLGFDVYDQVYAVELSHAASGHLLQVSVGPGRADAVIHDDGQRALTAMGRLQLDFSPRTILVLSTLVRGASQVEARNGSGGLALGLAPSRRISMWTEGDVEIHGRATAYVLLNETSVEVYRGIWIKVSPQWRTDVGDTGGGTFRTVVEADLLPRTHVNADVSLYRDVDHSSGLVTRTILAQLHLYL